MTRRTSALLLFLLVVPSFPLIAAQTRFMSRLDILGDRIVFVYEGDLWAATVDGAAPRRITANPGGETAPRFSPDGKWIACTGVHSGMVHVFLISADGGTPKRTTWLPGNAIVVGWTEYFVIDDGRVELSNNAVNGTDGNWLVDNHGADPDILRDNDPASVVAGRDLPLKKAIEVALRKIREEPWQFPLVPRHPKK